eukprot:311120-Rhodomonas_salina.2
MSGQVAGIWVENMDDKELHNVLLGSDIPGSTVQMLVQDSYSVQPCSPIARVRAPRSAILGVADARGGAQGREKTVELIRVDSMKIADHRRIFEFFNDIKLRIKVPLLR